MSSKRPKKQKNRTAQLRRRKRRRSILVRSVVNVLSCLGLLALSYYFISQHYESPLERRLLHSNNEMRSNISLLEARYDSLDMVLKNIAERDRGVFNTMFGTNPHKFDDEEESRVISMQENIISGSTASLTQSLVQRRQSFEQKVAQLTRSSETMLYKIDSVGDMMSHLPSIQPIANTSLRLLTASFGERIHPFYKSLQPHNGVDFTISEGTRVFATADGVIKSYSTKQSSTGKSIVIDHGNGYETVYNHLSIVDIPRSRRVKRGDIIGMSGNTGLSLMPHLHYEVRYHGVPCNPIHYFFEELTPTTYQQIQHIAETGMQSFD